MQTVRLPRRAARALSRALLGDVGIAEKLLRLDEEDLASARQPDISLVAIEEQRVELLLELLDAAADMRLGDAQLLRGVTEVQMLGRERRTSGLP